MRVTLAEEVGHEEHGGSSFWSEYMYVQFDPAHLLSELGFTIALEIVQVVVVLWLWKKKIQPRWFAKAHAAIDAQHGIEHHDDHIHSPSKLINHTGDLLTISINGAAKTLQPGETYTIVRQSSVSKT